jgi:hypothetical protein
MLSLPLKNQSQLKEEQSLPFFCTLSLPIEYVEVPIIMISIKVEGLKKPITPKPIPLMILEIGVGVEVTLIDIIMLLRFLGLQI